MNSLGILYYQFFHESSQEALYFVFCEMSFDGTSLNNMEIAVDGERWFAMLHSANGVFTQMMTRCYGVGGLATVLRQGLDFIA